MLDLSKRLQHCVIGSTIDGSDVHPLSTPQALTTDLAIKVLQAMTTLNAYRNSLMLERSWGITDVYNAYFYEPASQLSKLHQSLDTLGLNNYGWSPKDDILRNLRLELSGREATEETVVESGVPS